MADPWKFALIKDIPPIACRTTPAPQSECRLCLREMTDPRVMACWHVFCLECIVGCKVDGGIYECKMCKWWTQVQNDDLKNLPVDFGLVNYIERKRYEEGLAHCVWCAADQSTLAAYCIVCQGFLCYACETCHHDIEYFLKCRGHLYPIPIYFWEELWKFKQFICLTHGSFTEFFCNICYTSKCPNCITEVCLPAGHRYDWHENYAHNVREAMRAAVNSPQRQIPEDIQNPLRREATLKQIGRITQETVTQGIEWGNPLKEDSDKAYAAGMLSITIDMNTPRGLYDFSKFELPNVSSPSQPVGPSSGACRNLPATGGGDIFTNIGMFVSDTKPSRSRDLLKSSLVQRQTILCAARLGELGTHVIQFKEPSGVAVNKEGDIFVADANSNIIQVFGKDGVYRRSIGGNGQLMFPNQVAICPKSGHVVVTERAPNNQVQVFTQDGRFVRKFGQGTIQHPRGITVDNRGRTIVVECKVMRVCIFDERGERLKMFECSKHLQFPTGVVANDREEIFISDNRSHCVKVFGYNGAYLRSIGGESITNYPIGVCMSSSGELWVVDNHINFNVTVFNQRGDMIAAYENRKVHIKCLDFALMKDGSIVVASQDGPIYVFPVGNECNGGLVGNEASGSSLAGNESNATQINTPEMLGTGIWWENSK